METENNFKPEDKIQFNKVTVILLALIILPLAYVWLTGDKTPTETPITPAPVQAPAPAASASSQIDAAKDAVAKNPGFDSYLQLGLAYYLNKEYQNSIDASLKAIGYKPNNPTAWNNLGSAYNALEMWDKGIEACEYALKLQPDFQLAKNNLNWAKQSKKK